LIGDVHLSKEAENFLQLGNSTFQLAHVGCNDDALNLIGGVFTYWDRFTITPNKGVLTYLKETAKLNPHLTTMWENAIDEDIQYWRDSRVTGDFYVLFERCDGTILIQYERNKANVYLVVGLAQSIGDLFCQGPGPLHQKLCYNTAPFKDFYWTGSLIGQPVKATLLNFDGKITYDGNMIVGYLQVDNYKRNLKRLLSSYIEAVNNNKIIKILPKILKTNNTTPAATPSSPSPSPNISISENSKKLLIQLKTVPESFVFTDKELRDTSIRSYLMGQSNFVFRRHGYTEKENPNHLITVLSTLAPGGLAIIRARTKKLVPSLDEYIELLMQAIKNSRNMRPYCILIDSIEQVEAVKSMLKDFIPRIHVQYYPPPSAEEERLHQDPAFKNINTDHYKSPSFSCAVCHAQKAPDGGKLKVCSRCNKTKYCSAEHQKQHWKTHKEYCCP